MLISIIVLVLLILLVLRISQLSKHITKLEDNLRKNYVTTAYLRNRMEAENNTTQ
jgi:hypothetical protein